MSKTSKIAVAAFGVLLGLVLLVPVAVYLLFDINAYKPKFESAASELAGMQVTVGGRMRIDYFPGLSIRLNDVRVRNRGSDLIDARQVDVGMRLIPLLHGQVVVDGISVQHVKLTIERDRQGVFNFQSPQSGSGESPAMRIASITLSDGAMNYADESTGTRVAASGCRLALRDVRLASGTSAELIRYLTTSGQLSCAKVHSANFAATDLSTTVKAKNGVVDASPIAMTAYAGHGSGSFHADYSGEKPDYRLRCDVPGLNVDEFLQSVGSKRTVKGTLDFSTRLTMHGGRPGEMKRSMDGVIALKGHDLTIEGTDLDKTLAQYRSSQHFDLLDAGAFLFAGPVGVAVTKGYDFANVMQGSPGNTRVRRLVADWHVDNGKITARDVALATDKNRLAVAGSLDLANDRFDDLNIALVNQRGCAMVRQHVHGSFAHPIVDKPDVVESLAGPVVKLLKKARNLLPHDKCPVFYAGSVAAPQHDDAKP